MVTAKLNIFKPFFSGYQDIFRWPDVMINSLRDSSNVKQETRNRKDNTHLLNTCDHMILKCRFYTKNEYNLFFIILKTFIHKRNGIRWFLLLCKANDQHVWWILKYVNICLSAYSTLRGHIPEIKQIRIIDLYYISSVEESLIGLPEAPHKSQ